MIAPIYSSLPPGWRLKPLKATVDGCINGIWGNEPDGSAADIACVRVADFDRRTDRVSNAPTLRAVAEAERQNRVLQRGDLLLEKSGGGELQPVGKVVLFDLEHPAVCSNFVARMPVARAHDSRFLCYLHRALYEGRVNTRHIKQSTGIQNLDSSAYLSEHVAVPDLKLQGAIADFLDRQTAKIDALITHNRHLSELLDLQGRTHAAGLFSGQHSTLKIGWIGRVGNGSTPSREEPAYWNGDVPWLTSGKVHEGVIGSAEEFVTSEAVRENHLPLVSAGSVVVAITGEGKTRGTAALLSIDSTISQHLAHITVTDRRVDAEYLCLWFQTQYEVLREASAGGGSTKAALTCEYLRSLRFPVPPLAEQREIVTTARNARKGRLASTKALERGIEKLREYRSALITVAVTGQIDLTNSVRTELSARENSARASENA